MRRFIRDRFAKEYLEELLSPLGTVNIGREVTSEVREVDIYFTPNTTSPAYSSSLGLLGKMANTTKSCTGIGHFCRKARSDNSMITIPPDMI